MLRLNQRKACCKILHFEGEVFKFYGKHWLQRTNDVLQGGLRPHNFCLPILKREEHRQAVLTAAVSGNPRFFLGTDSAPHAVGDKVSV